MITSRPARIAIETVAVLVLAGIAAVIVTWPVATSFSSLIVGGSGSPSDSMGYWWDIWNNSRNGLDVWGAAVHDQLGYPFGRPIVGSGNFLLLTFTGPAMVIASFASAAATLNTLVLAGIALTGASMYLLIRWLGMGIGVAAWAGLAFMLAPYELFRAAAHVPLAHLEWAPLLLMAGIAWIVRPSWWRGLLVALATLFGWITNPYYGVMATTVAGVVLLVGLVVFLRRRESTRQALTHWGAGAAWLIALVGVPVALLTRASRGATESVTRLPIELDLYGARLWDYIIPPPGTRLSEALVGPGGIDPGRSPGGERIVFIGWLVLALALAGLVLAALAWRTLASRHRVALAVAGLVAIVAAAFSLASPIRLWGLEFEAPSSIVFDYLPYLRAYARFGSVVLAATLVIAALGLFLIVRHRSVLWRYSWIAGALVISAVEMPIGLPLASGPPLLAEGRVPADVPAWQWLASNKYGQPVIETPAFTGEATDRAYMAGQTIHGHPIANGGLNERNAAADFTEEFGSPLFPRSAAAYATAGIRLVTVQPWAYAMQGLTPPNPNRPPPGMRVLKAFPDQSAVWQVTAQPLTAVAFPDRTTWDPVRTVDGVRWRFMRDGGVMRVYAPRATQARVSFAAQGFRQDIPYVLTITQPNGKAVRVPVSGRRTVDFTTSLPRGASAFTVAVASPGQAPGEPTVETSPWAIIPVDRPAGGDAAP